MTIQNSARPDAIRDDLDATKPTLDWAAVAEALTPVRCDLSSAIRKRKSRDYFWFSPILTDALDGIIADLVVTPRDEEELLLVARYCLEHRIQITPRGGGTGNYGQAVPLGGGIVLDLGALDGIAMVRPGIVRAGAGAKLFAIDKAMRDHGWAMRLYPSTWRSATIGGFIGGGSGGFGAVNYGSLFTPGNVIALRLLTFEAEPRFIELRGDELAIAVHTFGTTGIITEVEMALTPAITWHERVIATPDLGSAIDLGKALGCSAGLHLNEIAVLDAATLAHARPLAAIMQEGESAVIVEVAENSVETLDHLVPKLGGTIRLARAPGDARGGIPAVSEFCWNHTTLHAVSGGTGTTYIQCLYPDDGKTAALALQASFGDEISTHIEFCNFSGELRMFGIPLVRFSSPERLAEVSQAFRDAGCIVYDSHSPQLEDAQGRHVANPALLQFKRLMDPHGLLGAGKMPGWPIA